MVLVSEKYAPRLAFYCAIAGSSGRPHAPFQSLCQAIERERFTRPCSRCQQESEQHTIAVFDSHGPQSTDDGDEVVMSFYAPPAAATLELLDELGAELFYYRGRWEHTECGVKHF